MPEQTFVPASIAGDPEFSVKGVIGNPAARPCMGETAMSVPQCRRRMKLFESRLPQGEICHNKNSLLDHYLADDDLDSRLWGSQSSGRTLVEPDQHSIAQPNSRSPRGQQCYKPVAWQMDRPRRNLSCARKERCQVRRRNPLARRSSDL
jgi:hypothetical protein